MWTYLLILFSIATVLGVFIRRVYLYVKAKNAPAVADIPQEEEEEVLKKKRLSAQMKEEVDQLCQRGKRMVEAGKDDEAIKCFVQALAIDELHQETQHRLAMLYLNKQMYSAAAVLFQQLGNLTNDAVHFSHLGLALYQQSNYPEALKAYQKSVELDDTRPQRFISLSQVYRAMGRLHHAIMAISKAIEIDRDNLEHLLILADVQIAMGNVKEGEEILKKLIEIDPEFTAAKQMLKETAQAQVQGL